MASTSVLNKRGLENVAGLYILLLNGTGILLGPDRSYKEKKKTESRLLRQTFSFYKHRPFQIHPIKLYFMVINCIRTYLRH